MTLLAPTLEAFFTQHMSGHRQASPRTIGSYRDTWRLFLGYTLEKTGTAPAAIDIAALDAGLVSGFLAHLEQDRGNTARTRNARLAAIRSFFKFAALRHPEHAGSIARVLAVPAKKHGRRSVAYLTGDETAALLAAPDTGTWHGRRDHALLALAAQTGLRSSELTGLTRGDVQTGTGPTVRCHGKGRKDRVTPLTANVAAVIRNWLREQPGDPGDPLFPTRTGRRMSSDAVQDLAERHAATAAAGCPSIRDKHVTPHTLRHTAAMALLHAGVNPVTIALWMGHESPRSTQPYIHADLKLKEKALARTASPKTKTGRYRPPDKLLAFLEGLGLCRSADTREHGRQGIPGDRRHNRGPGITSVCRMASSWCMRQEMSLVDDQCRDPAALAVLGGEQAGGLGGERRAAVGGPAAERGDHLVVDAAGAGGGVGEVNQGVPGLIERGDGGAGGGGLAGADFAGDHGEGALAGAPGDPGDGLGVRGVVVQHRGGEVLAERGAGEPVMVAQVDHCCSLLVACPAASGRRRMPRLRLRGRCRCRGWPSRPRRVQRRCAAAGWPWRSGKR